MIIEILRAVFLLFCCICDTMIYQYSLFYTPIVTL